MSDQKTENIGKQAAYLSLIEIGLGSFLHALKIPFSGHFLSLNQIAFMSRITKIEKSKDAALQISVIASLLKSLSPAGKKLTPMLAILAQGLCFSLGIFIFGVNPLGFVIGSIFSSLWAFIQPILMIYLLFGKSSIDVAEHFYKEILKIITIDMNYLLYAVLIFIGLKVLLAVFVSFFAMRISDKKFNEYQAKMIQQRKKKKPKKIQHPALMALRDLLSPLFLVSLAMTALFFYVSNAEQTQMIWGLMRPLAVGFILFFIIRVYQVERFSIHLEKIGLHKLSSSLKTAIEVIRKFQT